MRVNSAAGDANESSRPDCVRSAGGTATADGARSIAVTRFKSLFWRVEFAATLKRFDARGRPDATFDFSFADSPSTADIR